MDEPVTEQVDCIYCHQPINGELDDVLVTRSLSAPALGYAHGHCVIEARRLAIAVISGDPELIKEWHDGVHGPGAPS